MGVDTGDRAPGDVADIVHAALLGSYAESHHLVHDDNGVLHRDPTELDVGACGNVPAAFGGWHLIPCLAVCLDALPKGSHLLRCQHLAGNPKPNHALPRGLLAAVEDPVPLCAVVEVIHIELLPGALALAQQVCQLVDLCPACGATLGQLHLLLGVDLAVEDAVLGLFRQAGAQSAGLHVNLDLPGPHWPRTMDPGVLLPGASADWARLGPGLARRTAHREGGGLHSLRHC
mmetsp:Transcript_10513/g.29913  ORF Transcript_10513/g.29913 Transcript_10513/m.29913 type:complete len:231 (-) Transcript_10513:78-770(-)